MQRYERKPVPTLSTTASGYQVMKLFDHYGGVMVLVGHKKGSDWPWACWKWDARNGHVAAVYSRTQAEANAVMVRRIAQIISEERKE